ncbi:FAD-dependent oxidoreductase, partial [Kribbella sp. NPDC059898]|uniref:FAD-dependent oxidoreductase n=1 Tax=Kribbella sp. NPDC059898 TaxID=3346995 RepID=UPI00365B91F1
MSDQLRYFGPAPANWVRTTVFDHDVVVVGAGQAGLGIGFALRRAGIGRATVVDAAAPGEAGVWTTTARMRTLRTPKAWPEPEYGFPELSFRAWYEGRYDEAAYDELDRIPRTVWAGYVAWFEQTVKVAVRNHTRLIGVTPAADHLVLRLAVTRPDAGVDEVVETTRKLVLANGVEGTGGPYLPPPVADLPRHLAAHTGDRIDFPALAGQVVAVLGAGASALDAAGTALEAGASEVHLFTRRPELIVQGPKAGPAQNLGGREHFHRRSDADRWRAKASAAGAGRSCTLESVQHASAFSGFRVHLSAPWHHARVEDGKVRVDAADGSHLFDFVIAGTGYQYNPRTRPELAEIADHVALWADRYQPPSELSDESLARFPYLGGGY